jgi:hypothetical protein
MSAPRKHDQSNRRIHDAHERKELKEEQKRLIAIENSRLQNRSKPRSKQHRRVHVEFDARGFVI